MAPALKTIEETFHAALECDPKQLSDFLDTRCAGDEALRTKVEALLASHRKAGHLSSLPSQLLQRVLLETGNIAR